ncbi:hypothetical protein [Corallococcus llansteffanensis]|uniref:DUF5673 domain-containing protein n=1 Tax=Corallococcus llansteffanensis TaxID=2316731 RepID=A0A3A8N6J1_9BACT|nr:hypothetical protein [Corallococcus llansteffanensis]RKH36725.1 hypothetical protein D7V93_42770 [Corallococcus llansteffanensis]
MSATKTPSRPVSALAFHGVTLVFFAGCAAWLVRESRGLGGRPGMMGLGVAVAAGGLALLALGALVGLLRGGRLAALQSRAEMGTYALVLAALGVLALVGLRLLGAEGRPALATFCLGLSAWLVGVGLHAVPALFLAPDGFIDSLGRRTPFARLEWFSLQKDKGELPRVLFQAGHGTRLLLDARLASADADAVRAALLRAGLASRPRGR